MNEEGQEHITASMLERFFCDQLSRPEARFLVRHLLTDCPRCLETAALVSQRSGWGFGNGEELGPSQQIDIQSVGAKFLEVSESEANALRLAAEQLQADALLAELLKRPTEDRLSAIQGDARFHCRGLFDRILVSYLEAARNEPRAGIDLVLLALAIVECLPEERYKREILNDYRAAGMAALANARRLAGLFEESKQALKIAWVHIGDGTGDPLEEANLLSIEASLWRDLGQLDRSVGVLDQAIQIYRQVGDNNRWARVLIQKGLAVGYAEPRRGIKVLRNALALVEVAQEPRLELCAYHNLALFLAEEGEAQEALEILEKTRPLYEAFDDHQTQLLLHWLEARIARSLGRVGEAEAVLQTITAEFETRGMPYEQVIATIDLVHTVSSYR